MAKHSSGQEPKDRFRKTIFPALRFARDRQREAENPKLSDLLERLGPNGPSILILILSLPFSIPMLSLGPITVAISIVIITLSTTQLLPSFQSRLNSRLTISLNPAVVNGLRKVAAKLAGWRHRERKLPVVTIMGIDTRRIVLNTVIIFHAVLLALPIPLLPLTNTLPAMSIAFFSMAILRRNDLHTIFGIIATALTIAWFALIAYVGVQGVLVLMKTLLGWQVAAGA
jgi:hypothetical protein